MAKDDQRLDSEGETQSKQPVVRRTLPGYDQRLAGAEEPYMQVQRPSLAGRMPIGPQDVVSTPMDGHPQANRAATEPDYPMTGRPARSSQTPMPPFVYTSPLSPEGPHAGSPEPVSPPSSPNPSSSLPGSSNSPPQYRQTMLADEAFSPSEARPPLSGYSQPFVKAQSDRSAGHPTPTSGGFPIPIAEESPAWQPRPPPVPNTSPIISLHSEHQQPPLHFEDPKDANSQTEIKPEYRLFISPSRSINLYRGFLGRLVRSFALDVGDQSALSSKAVPELHFMAMVLGIIVVFEFTAWSLLFVAILNAGHLTFFSWFTPLACLFGATMATLIFVFERQILVSDPAKKGRKLWYSVAYLARIALVLVSAFFTARPVEVMAFASRIKTRAYEEQVLEKAARLLQDYEDLKQGTKVNRTKAGQEAQQQIEGQNVRNAQSKLEQATRDLARLSVAITNAEDDVTFRRHKVREGTAKLAQVQRDRDDLTADAPLALIEAADQELKKWTGRLQWRKNKLRDARAHRNQVKAKRAEVVALMPTLRGDVNTTTQRFTERRGELEQIEVTRATNVASDLGKLTAFIEKIRDAEPGTVFEPPSGDPESKLSFVPVSYDMYEQLRVLDDLLNARPPAWPVTSTSRPGSKPTPQRLSIPAAEAGAVPAGGSGSRKDESEVP